MKKLLQKPIDIALNVNDVVHDALKDLWWTIERFPKL